MNFKKWRERMRGQLIKCPYCGNKELIKYDGSWKDFFRWDIEGNLFEFVFFGMRWVVIIFIISWLNWYVIVHMVISEEARPTTIEFCKYIME